jgi:hypothetical protein
MVELNTVSGKHERPKKNYLWKYLDFYKALSFFKNQKLFFSPLNKFDDPFEGASKDFAFEMQTYINLVRMDNTNAKKEYTNENKRRIQEQLSLLEGFQKQFLSCCLFESNDESEAMWKMYSENFGIALRFKSDELFKSIENEFKKNTSGAYEFYYGPMDYCKIKTPDNETIFDLNQHKNSFNPFIKDKTLIYEEEFRFVIHNKNKEFSEIKIGDVKNIEYDIFLPSKTENWQILQIEELLKHYDVNRKVRTSITISREFLKTQLIELIL